MASFNQSFHGYYVPQDVSSDNSELSDQHDYDMDMSGEEFYDLTEIGENNDLTEIEESNDLVNEFQEEDIDGFTDNLTAVDFNLFLSTICNSQVHILLSAVLYAFVYKGFSEEGLNCILSLLLSYTSIENFPKTIKSMIKKFKTDIFNYDEHVHIRYYCKKCNAEIFLKSKICCICNEYISCTATLDIFIQLKLILCNNFFQIKNYQNLIKNIDNGDILYGLDYYTDENTSLKISLQINSDGGNLYSTSGYSYWPLFALILDLPPTLRYKPENIILLSLWCGPSKPAWDFFLKAMLSSIPFNEPCCFTIGEHSFNLTVSIYQGVFDLPALASILNIKQYNGKFGCLFCNHPGQFVDKSWTYPYTNMFTSICDKDYSRHAELAHKSKETVFGVKGYSVLQHYLSIPSGINLDPLHLYFENITKMLLTFMLCSTNRHNVNYIGRKVNHINTFIQSVTVPHNMNKFRTLNSMKFWTGRDFQNFLYYLFLPLIGFTLPYSNFIHLASLVIAVRLSTSCEARNFKTQIEKLFLYFVQNMNIFFSNQQLTINVHLLTHVSEKISHSGSLNYSSMAPFEAQFKMMKKVIKGTQGHLNQVVNKFLLQKATSSFLLSASKNPNIHLQHVTSVLNISIPFPIANNIKLIDAHRLQIHHNIFHTVAYPKAQKSKSCYCRTKLYYGRIMNFYVNFNIIFVKIQVFETIKCDLFAKHDDSISKLLNDLYPIFFNFVKLRNEFIHIAATDIVDKCLLLENVRFKDNLFSLLCNLPDCSVYS